MTINIEPVGRLLRLVVDAVNECNLRCLYCHPGEVWRKQQLPIEVVRRAFRAAEYAGLLEVVLSGGEITLHHDLMAVLDATHILRRTASTLITNATQITPAIAKAVAASNLTRVCVSVDGITNELHGSARGRNLPRVLIGLDRLADTGKPVTVITVVHRSNWEKVIELTEFLAQYRFAVQHHLCAPSYSGQARQHYPRLALREEDFHAVQRLVNRNHGRLLRRGVYLTFNSYWPATGEPTLIVNSGRTITLQQLSEQVKDTLCNVRPNGEFRLQSATWGREMVGNAVIGRLPDEPAADLLARAERKLASGQALQLPRAVEAQHKFQLGTAADRHLTEHLIDRAQPDPGRGAETVPITGLDAHWLMLNPAPINALVAALTRNPEAFRTARHPSGIVLLFEPVHSMVTLLRPDEWRTVSDAVARDSAVRA